MRNKIHKLSKTQGKNWINTLNYRLIKYITDVQDAWLLSENDNRFVKNLLALSRDVLGEYEN